MTSWFGKTKGATNATKLAGFHGLVKECLERGLRLDAVHDADALRYYKQAGDIAQEALALTVEHTATTALLIRELENWQDGARDRVRALTNATPLARASPSASMRTTLRTGGWTDSSAGQRAVPPKQSSVDTDEARVTALVLSEVLVTSPTVHWDDVSGLKEAKRCLHEMCVLPTLRPDLFTGLRAPATGLLLFGPPGTGKTLLARAVASESGATFFSISASSLTSKWMGDSEKIVRTLFRCAAERAPSVIFLDEVDSVLSARTSNEHEASRRLKTEFLCRLDGCTPSSGRVVVIAATNRPQELDDAVIRRLTRRIYVPLPDEEAREALLVRLLSGNTASALLKADIRRLVAQTDGYSGSDIAALCREAAMAPLRELNSEQLARVDPDRVRPLNLRDFDGALRGVGFRSRAQLHQTLTPALKSSGQASRAVRWLRLSAGERRLLLLAPDLTAAPLRRHRLTMPVDARPDS
jgi:spastin